MINVFKGFVLVGLVATTAAFTHTTVFNINEPARGLTNMHHELVVNP